MGLTEYIDYLDFMENDANLRRERVIQNRQNPFAMYEDEDFVMRFRLSKGTGLKYLTLLKIL